MKGQLFVGSDQVADQPRRLRHDGERCCPQAARPLARTWPRASRAQASAAPSPPGIECAPAPGRTAIPGRDRSCRTRRFASRGPASASRRFCERSCSPPVDTIARFPLGSTAVGPSSAVPSRGSSVKNDLPKLTEISGASRDGLGTNVNVALGEFSPTSLLHEFAGVIRSWLSMKISSRRQPA
jgi:hypothetical protein